MTRSGRAQRARAALVEEHDALVCGCDVLASERDTCRSKLLEMLEAFEPLQRAADAVIA